MGHLANIDTGDMITSRWLFLDIKTKTNYLQTYQFAKVEPHPEDDSEVVLIKPGILTIKIWTANARSFTKNGSNWLF